MKHPSQKYLLIFLILISTLACSLMSTRRIDPVTAVPANEQPTQTEVITAAPEASATNTIAVPSATSEPEGLSPDGPHFLFSGPGGVWITNPDGSFATRLSSDPFQNDLRTAVSPDSLSFTQIVRTESGFDLLVVDIPTGVQNKIAHLMDITSDEAIDATSKKSFAMYAIDSFNNAVWQPGKGEIIAFTAAINGPTSDLYTYNTLTGVIDQLTDGPSQAILPIWSPDGQYILHFGISYPPPYGGAIGGTIGARMDGMWSVQLSTGNVITIPKTRNTWTYFVDWLDDTHAILYDSDETCASTNLRSVDVTTGKSVPIMNHTFYYQIARSPIDGNFLFSGSDDCKSSPGVGIFLLQAGQQQPEKIFDKKAYEVDWLPESGLFDAYPEGLFNSDGSVHYLPPVYDASYHPVVSKAGYQAWEVIQDRKGRVEVKLDQGDWQTVLTGLVDEMIWDPVDGKTLLVVLDDGSLYAVQFPEGKANLLGKLDKNIDQAIWLK